MLVAVTVSVPVVAGAVYIPFASTVPVPAFHVTDVSVAFETVAENCCVAPGASDAVVGEIDTDTGGGGFNAACAAVTESFKLFTIFWPCVIKDSMAPGFTPLLFLIASKRAENSFAAFWTAVVRSDRKSTRLNSSHH